LRSGEAIEDKEERRGLRRDKQRGCAAHRHTETHTQKLWVKVKVSVEKCFRCGRPCSPVLYVRSKRGRTLALCGKCAPAWLEGGRMPE